ncbi:MAG: class I SAM-dependent methyltransferase [Gemmatimonadetes bacterium]|nr:class I SAM-dependent methyltransferase [Gemmatimonadota bacterium]
MARLELHRSSSIESFRAAQVDTGATRTGPEELYLDLMKRVLTRSGFESDYGPIHLRKGSTRALVPTLGLRLLRRSGFDLRRRVYVDAAARAEGRDWPSEAETMVGLRRLDHLQGCIADILSKDVPGDLIETGVWRGGASIFMRAALGAFGDTDRVVWVADSFAGLPKPEPEAYPHDRGDRHWTLRALAVSRRAVEANFARYGLLDEQVRFLEGWFKDTLPDAPIENLSIIRLDGDMYQSTMEALQALYPKLSIGGYLIVDDYGNDCLPACRQAVEDFRAEFGISEVIEEIDWTGVSWQRLR